MPAANTNRICCCPSFLPRSRWLHVPNDAGPPLDTDWVICVSHPNGAQSKGRKPRRCLERPTLAALASASLTGQSSRSQRPMSTAQRCKAGLHWQSNAWPAWPSVWSQVFGAPCDAFAKPAQGGPPPGRQTARQNEMRAQRRPSHNEELRVVQGQPGAQRRELDGGGRVPSPVRVVRERARA